jgi:hypothetical protein
MTDSHVRILGVILTKAALGVSCSGQVFQDSKLSLFSAAAGLKPLL